MTHAFTKSRFFPFLAVLLAGACLISGPAVAEDVKDLSGHWKGTIDTPGMKLEINVDFTKEGEAWKGDISIPVQNAVDLPLGSISLTDAEVGFEMPGVPGDPKFAGTLSSDGKTISGDFAQGGQTFPFALTRGERLSATAKTTLEGFDEFVEQALKDWNAVGLAVGIVVEDDVVYARGFGLRNREEKLPATSKTLFAIGSCTKAFTTFAMATLVDEGLLEWDKPVIEYLPEFRLFDEHATSHITPRDMVTHRSGLPRHDLVWYNSPAPREELVGRLAYLEPSKDLREQFQYNNLMFMSAGYLVGRLTGGTWEDAIRYRVFQPLGMKHSNFSVEQSKRAADFALPYEEKDDEIRKMAFRNIDNVGPAGSINSNVDDMVRWLLVHLNKGKIDGDQIINEATLSEMHTPQMAITALPTDVEVSPGSYSLGWMTDTYQGHYRVRHGGGIDGFTALVTLFPRDRLGIVALANMSGNALPGLVTLHATDRILGLESKDWNAEALEKRAVAKAEQKKAEEKKEMTRKSGTQPAHALAEYAGQYEHPGYGVLAVSAKDDQLQVTYNDITTPFSHWHYEVFNGLENPHDHTFEDMKIRFLTNMKGEIDAVVGPFEPSVDEIVFKRKPDARMFDPEYLAQFLGMYEIAGQPITISLKGNVLTAQAAGQPQFELLPDRNDEFNLKGVTGYSVKFVKDDEGGVTAFFNQPNGVFEAKRKTE